MASKKNSNKKLTAPLRLPESKPYTIDFDATPESSGVASNMLRFWDALKENDSLSHPVINICKEDLYALISRAEDIDILNFAFEAIDKEPGRFDWIKGENAAIFKKGLCKCCNPSDIKVVFLSKLSDGVFISGDTSRAIGRHLIDFVTYSPSTGLFLVLSTGHIETLLSKMTGPLDYPRTIRYSEDRLTIRFIDLLTYPRKARKFSMLLGPTIPVAFLRELLYAEVGLKDVNDLVLITKNKQICRSLDEASLQDIGLKEQQLVMISRVLGKQATDSPPSSSRDNVHKAVGEILLGTMTHYQSELHDKSILRTFKVSHGYQLMGMCLEQIIRKRLSDAFLKELLAKKSEAELYCLLDKEEEQLGKRQKGSDKKGKKNVKADKAVAKCDQVKVFGGQKEHMIKNRKDASSSASNANDNQSTALNIDEAVESHGGQIATVISSTDVIVFKTESNTDTDRRIMSRTISSSSSAAFRQSSFPMLSNSVVRREYSPVSSISAATAAFDFDVAPLGMDDQWCFKKDKKTLRREKKTAGKQSTAISSEESTYKAPAAATHAGKPDIHAAAGSSQSTLPRTSDAINAVVSKVAGSVVAPIDNNTSKGNAVLVQGVLMSSKESIAMCLPAKRIGSTSTKPNHTNTATNPKPARKSATSIAAPAWDTILKVVENTTDRTAVQSSCSDIVSSLGALSVADEPMPPLEAPLTVPLHATLSPGFSSNSGLSVDFAAREAPLTTSLFCQHCRSQLSSSHRFCWSCGAPTLVLGHGDKGDVRARLGHSLMGMQGSLVSALPLALESSLLPVTLATQQSSLHQATGSISYHPDHGGLWSSHIQVADIQRLNMASAIVAAEQAHPLTTPSHTLYANGSAAALSPAFASPTSQLPSTPPIAASPWVSMQQQPQEGSLSPATLDALSSSSLSSHPSLPSSSDNGMNNVWGHEVQSRDNAAPSYSSYSGNDAYFGTGAELDDGDLNWDVAAQVTSIFDGEDSPRRARMLDQQSHLHGGNHPIHLAPLPFFGGKGQGGEKPIHQERLWGDS